MNLTFPIVVVALIAMFVLLVRAILGQQKTEQMRARITSSGTSQPQAASVESGAKTRGN